MTDNNQPSIELIKIYEKLSDEASDLEKGKLKLRELMRTVTDGKNIQKILQYIDNLNN